VNTEVLGWIVARASGLSVPDLLSQRIWRRLGMEQSAYFTVDGIGTAFAGGGLNAGLRDMARFGEMMRNNGRFASHPIAKNAAYDAYSLPAYHSLAKFLMQNHPGIYHR
jgi:CubicO group peptidase (beta-lactamase class C family)